MKKYLLDLLVKRNVRLNERYILLVLTTDGQPLPEMLPGQFVEVRTPAHPATFLRRPISINMLDREANELWLLVALVGDGTRSMATLKEGDTLNCLLPLGNGFTMPEGYRNGKETRESMNSCLKKEHVLLVGGGVGVAPLLYCGKEMAAMGVEPTFLLGARSAKDLLELDEFEKYGRVLVTTEDGSLGEKGFVTQHSVWQNEKFDRVSMCGPKPMMVNVARLAASLNIDCEASLENMMACGVGACLCCVEKTKEGNLCVCKEGPVFNTKRLNLSPALPTREGA